MAGDATYTGNAGGVYVYIPEGDRDAAVVDEYLGTITLSANFPDRMPCGCIGCVGKLSARRALFGAVPGEEVLDSRSLIPDYELHLGAAPSEPTGTVETADIAVTHPERTLTFTEGFWGGACSVGSGCCWLRRRSHARWQAGSIRDSPNGIAPAGHVPGRNSPTAGAATRSPLLAGTAAPPSGRQALSSIVEPLWNRCRSILCAFVKALLTKGPIEESHNPDRLPPPRRSAGSARGYRTNDGSLDTDRLERGKREELIRPNCDSPQ